MLMQLKRTLALAGVVGLTGLLAACGPDTEEMEPENEMYTPAAETAVETPEATPTEAPMQPMTAPAEAPATSQPGATSQPAMGGMETTGTMGQGMMGQRMMGQDRMGTGTMGHDMMTTGAMQHDAGTTTSPVADDATTPTASVPQEGEMAPEFTLAASTGEDISLSDYRGEQAVVLYFYPKDMTAGCTVEACGFRDSMGQLEAMDVAVLGVSSDSVATHKQFVEQEELNFPLLADTDLEVARMYGVAADSGTHAKRVTFLIGRDGKIVKVWESVDPASHAQEVAQAAMALPSA